MNKILTIEQAAKVSERLRAKDKKLVLAGGCFDILHVGHIQFIKNAKKHGDVLIVLLESDQKIRQLKGQNRPVNTQQDRATVLASLKDVDFVVTLPHLASDSEYDEMISRLKPAIIATTKGDPYKMHKDRQAKQIGSKVVDVTEQIMNQSTTRLADLLHDI